MRDMRCSGRPIAQLPLSQTFPENHQNNTVEYLCLLALAQHSSSHVLRHPQAIHNFVYKIFRLSSPITVYPHKYIVAPYTLDVISLISEDIKSSLRQYRRWRRAGFAPKRLESSRRSWTNLKNDTQKNAKTLLCDFFVQTFHSVLR